MAAYEARGESDEWYTPKFIFDALGERFDLDVAAPPEGPRYAPVDWWFPLGGLEIPWWGFVWMNPPFGDEDNKVRWLTKFFDHGAGIALLPDRTSAGWWQDAAARADGLLFTRGKIKFEKPDGSIGKAPGTGTTLFAAGPRAVAALRRSNLGWVACG